MPINPDSDPRGFAVFLIAAGLRMFSDASEPDASCFDRAESFVAEAEKRYGKF